MSKKTLFRGNITAQNTFIGGVGASINTAQLLATRLGIAVSRISNFEIVGLELRCRISGSYAMPAGVFQGDTSITFFNDLDSLVTNYETPFRNASALQSVRFNGIISPNMNATYVNCTILRLVELQNATSIIFISTPFEGVNNCRIAIQRCTNLGGTSGNNNIFQGVGINNLLYAHPSLQTNNAGAPDGDIIAFLAIAGNVVRYVTNFTAPPKPTFTVGQITNTAIQLNNLTSSGVNAIDYFEVYVNGVFRGNIQSGGYATGLIKNTLLNIQVIAVDIFFNKSPISDVNFITTANNATNIPLTNLIAYYKLDSNSVDSINAYNGTDTTITYVAGKVGNAASFNGSTSRIDIADQNDFSFTNGGGVDVPFTIFMWVRLTAYNTGAMRVINKRNNVSGGDEWQMLITTNGSVFFNKFDAISNTISQAIQSAAGVVPLNTDVLLAITDDGSKTFAGMKLFANATELVCTNQSSGVYTGMNNGVAITRIGMSAFNTISTLVLNGRTEEIGIYKNKALTQGEISDIHNNGNGTTL